MIELRLWMSDKFIWDVINESVRNEIMKRREVISEANIDVITRVNDVDRTVINSVVDWNIIGTIKSLTIEETWFLITKNASKNLSNNKFWILVAIRSEDKEIISEYCDAMFFI